MAQVVDHEPVAVATQVLLMPVLAAHLALAVPGPRPRLVRLVLVALGFSWLGDTVPRFLDGDAEFLSMVGGFLLAQIVFVLAFLPDRDRSVLARRRGWLVPYLLVFAALVAACLPHAGVLTPAVVVYGLLLLSMAVLSTGVHPLTWAGGAIFMVSDGLIALGEFATALPGDANIIAIMATYAVAQLLIVLGVTARSAQTERA
ncbi:lysoplasmalogenase [Saccharopolyspora flava]|uniref:lysoplasmalogenase n=1 Tax=Saccharopolyspora flava TaxID=95161 RepID=UPI00111483B9|nr:lysoplasmalogenase [Saccharopolyspora flava]